jgi:hypothetical protein
MMTLRLFLIFLAVPLLSPATTNAHHGASHLAPFLERLGTCLPITQVVDETVPAESHGTSEELRVQAQNALEPFLLAHAASGYLPNAENYRHPMDPAIMLIFYRYGIHEPPAPWEAITAFRDNVKACFISVIPPSSDPSLVQPNTTIVYGAWELTLLSANRDTSLPDSTLASAKQVFPKGVFINAVLTVKNLAFESANVPNFYVFDEAGRRFDQDGWAGLYGSYKYKVQSGFITRVQPSLSERVTIGFDVASDAKGLTIVPRLGPEPRPRLVLGI